MRFNRRESIGIVLACILAALYFISTPPTDFTKGTIVRIEHGTSVQSIAIKLSDAHVVEHPTLLRAILRLSGSSEEVQTGVYQFDTPENVLTVAYRLIMGEYGLPPVRLTFVEGVTVREMAVQVGNALPTTNAANFFALAKSHEGYLFPDTYFFQPSTDEATIVSTLQANFTAKVAPLQSDITTSGHSLSDIVTMASLIEKEARTTADRHMVAGILWNRVRLGMPLQVDAVFGYIFNRDTYSPSYADLKVDSLYNTYTHKGLPPGPICNPGLDALEAAITPTATNYLYYLTDKNGVMHYATTYAAHQANQRKYL